jgi:hypothetical protein
MRCISRQLDVECDATERPMVPKPVRVVVVEVLVEGRVVVVVPPGRLVKPSWVGELVVVAEVCAERRAKIGVDQ